MKLSRVLAGLTLLLFGVSEHGQAADSVAKQKSATSKTAASGRYRLVQGKGYTVCEQFLKNLNAFPVTDPPMVCEQKIHPTHPEFSKPQWEEMDVQGNLKLIFAIESHLARFTAKLKAPLNYNTWLAEFQERIKSGKAKPRLRKTILALNERGPEILAMYEPIVDECKNGGLEGDGGHVFVVHESDDDITVSQIGYNTDQRNVILIYGKRPYFVSAGFSIENFRTPVSAIQIDRVLPGQGFEGKYLADIRCSIHINKVQ